MKQEVEEPSVDLHSEYERLSKSENLFKARIGSWKKTERVTKYVVYVSFMMILGSLLSTPQGQPLFSSHYTLPAQFVSFAIGFPCFAVSGVLHLLSSEKVTQITKDLGLDKEERLFLRAYDTHENLDLYSSNPNRRPYFRKLALENAQEMAHIIGEWKYGNIGLVKRLVGDQIDLLKDNIQRLVLSNIAKGDDAACQKISIILVELCGYICSPSVGKLDELNGMMKDLPFKEYKVLARMELVSNYFSSRPRMSRIVFASCITTIVAGILLYLGQNWGLIVAVAVTCFWGAFAAFDKLFNLKVGSS